MKKLLLVLLGLSLFNSAHAGVGSGGGGKGVVCRDENKKVISVELLDLWEAKTIYGRNIPEATDLRHEVELQLTRLKHITQFDSIIDYGGDKIFAGSDAVLHMLQEKAEIFYTDGSVTWGNVKRLRGVHLELTPDSYEIARPEDCKVEQIVVYKDNIPFSRVLINQDLFDKMSIMNQASLIAHEALYKMLRDYYREPNSIRIRRAIGFVAAGNVFADIKSIIGSRYIECQDEDFVSKRARGYAPDRIYFYVYGQHDANNVGIATLLDRVGGYAALGYQRGSSYSVKPSLESILISTGEGSASGSGISAHSEVSFDVHAKFLIHSLKEGVEVELSLSENSPMQAEPSKPVKLKCELIQK